MPKTLTEFSGTMIRMAARAESEARKNIPKELLTVAPAPAPVEGVTAKPDETASAPGSEPQAADSVTDAADQALAGATDVEGTPAPEPKPGEAGTADDESQPGAAEEEEREEAAAGQDLAGSGAEGDPTAQAEAPAKEEAVAETSAVKEILDKAVADATGTSGDRLARLREALRASGRQAERVRLVRVFGTEEEVAGSKKIGEFQYIVDLMPHSMKQNFEQKDDKKRGPRRPSGGGGKKGAEGSLEGSFSMESVAQDRRNERTGGGGGRGGKPGGRPGGGRGGRPGGGRGGGGKPGGARK